MTWFCAGCTGWCVREAGLWRSLGYKHNSSINLYISHQFKNDVMPILDEMHSCNVYYFIFFNVHIFMFLYYHFMYFPDYRRHGFVRAVQVGVSGRRDRGAPSVMWSVCSNVN